MKQALKTEGVLFALLVGILMILMTQVVTAQSTTDERFNGSVSIGPAEERFHCFDTRIPVRYGLDALCGTKTDVNGKAWTVPSQVAVGGRTCTDLDNPLTGGTNRTHERGLATVIIDQDGEEITAYLYGDNYFELYVNNMYICRDPIGFTPFNTSVARFKASYPLTYTILLVDWEEYLGIGMEYANYNVGDGGFVASFSDGTVTNENWRCEVFYIAPLDDPRCVEGRDSSSCPSRPANHSTPKSLQALHFDLPANWTSASIDDSSWPNATIWNNATVRPTSEYTEHRAQFGKAKFIWSPNLDLDNQVVCRLTVSAPPQP